MKNQYQIKINRSEADGVYIAMVPELPGCMAHGATYEDALASIREAMENWLEIAKEIGKIPKRGGRLSP